MELDFIKKEYFIEVTNEDNIEYMNEIKRIFDKSGILNVGKVYS